MLKIIFRYLSVIALFFTIACNPTDVLGPHEKNINESLNVVVDNNEYQRLETLRKAGKGFSDPFTIDKVEVINDSLIITVSYYGAVSFNMGHTFTLYWSGQVPMIYPMIANLILTHDANGDFGKTKYTQQLNFSLKDIGIIDSKDYTFNVFSILNQTEKPDVGAIVSQTSGN